MPNSSKFQHSETSPPVLSSTNESGFFQQYVYQSAPIVRVDRDAARNFSFISHHVSERLANGDWQQMGGAGQEVYLELGTDNVLTSVSAYSFADGISEELLAKIPHSLRRSQGHSGYFSQSILGAGPFLYEEMEYSRDQLIKLYSRLRPERIAATYPTDTADTISFHEAGDSYGEWRELFFKRQRLDILLQQEYAGLVVTLYRGELSTDQVLPRLTDQPLLVGFQTKGPELLLNLSQLIQHSEATWWTDEQLRDVLTPQEYCYFQ
jgi:hypothetical protein